jgi:hypothetical protein
MAGRAMAQVPAVAIHAVVWTKRAVLIPAVARPHGSFPTADEPDFRDAATLDRIARTLDELPICGDHNTTLRCPATPVGRRSRSEADARS